MGTVNCYTTQQITFPLHIQTDGILLPLKTMLYAMSFLQTDLVWH